MKKTSREKLIKATGILFKAFDQVQEVYDTEQEAFHRKARHRAPGTLIKEQAEVRDIEYIAELITKASTETMYLLGVNENEISKPSAR